MAFQLVVTGTPGEETVSAGAATGLLGIYMYNGGYFMVRESIAADTPEETLKFYMQVGGLGRPLHAPSTFISISRYSRRTRRYFTTLESAELVTPTFPQWQRPGNRFKVAPQSDPNFLNQTLNYRRDFYTFCPGVFRSASTAVITPPDEDVQISTDLQFVTVSLRFTAPPGAG
ncbi:hypothetical protein Bbelb_347940 [Branchiostoma belcheri]|nr:hypothetical protein Bbelb_347940 [Branchiostoma belcheri]